MIECPCCQKQLLPSELSCEACDVSFKGEFRVPRLARLSRETQKLAEAFLIAGGNLKTLGESLDISYPTLRRKVDEMMQELTALYERDQSKISEILDGIERREIEPEKGLRLMKELNGEQ